MDLEKKNRDLEKSYNKQREQINQHKLRIKQLGKDSKLKKKVEKLEEANK